MKLRDYQKSDMKQTLKLMKKHDHVFFGAATGYGKSVVILKMVERFVKKGKRVLVLAPRRKLINQLTETLSDTYPSVIMGADTIYHKDSDVFIASSATLHRRLATHGKKYLGNIDVVIVDEAHMQTTGKSYDIIKRLYWEKAKWLGFTATPIDAQGYRLGGWDKTLYNHQTQDLVELGYLTPVDVLVEDVPLGLENVGMVGADYNEGELADFMSDDARVNNVFTMWKKYAKKKHTLIFAVNITHAEIIRDEFENNGIEVGIVHSKIHEADNEHTMDLFKRGKLKTVINVGMITVGVDLPITDCLIGARPTESIPLMMQMTGRGLRLHKKKKKCTILDLAGNVAQHGYPTRKRDFNRVRVPRDAPEPMEFNEMVCPYCEYSTQPRNCRREIIEEKLYVTTRTYCPNCDEIIAEVVKDTREIKRLKKVKDYTNTSKVTDTEVGNFVELMRVHKGYKPTWTGHVARLYNSNFNFKEEVKMLYNKHEAGMIKLDTAVNNLRKLQKEMEVR